MKAEKTYQFTTIDGKNIYSGDKYWSMIYGVDRLQKVTAYPMRYWTEGALRFSTKRAALQYAN